MVENWLCDITFINPIPICFFLICSLAENRTEGLSLSKIYAIFLITVPLGLLLHHPWNYLAFFSPLYWIGWTWIESSALESLEFGIIAIFITSGAIFIFFRHFLKKHVL